MIIGLSGFARSGKDATAARLVATEGFTRIAFADTLRDFLYALNPIVAFERGYHSHTDPLVVKENDGFWSPVYVQDVISVYGWDKYKESKYGNEIRRLLQRLGTEAGRQTLWDTIWIDAALKDLDPNKNYVVTDARFINEFEAIKALGGIIVRVERPGVGPANEHASEMEALQYDFPIVIDNDGTLDDLNRKVDALYRSFNYVFD